MLLRSSSTPLLGSLLHSSYSESPQKHPTPTIYHNHSIKLSSSNNGGGFHNVAKPMTPVSEIKAPKSGFRRVQSEGNLEQLGAASSLNVDDFSCSKKLHHRPMLEPIPSFSGHNLGTGGEDYDSDEDESEELRMGEISDRFVAHNLVYEQVRSVNGYRNVGFFQGEGKMYLATGTGIAGTEFCDGGGCGGGGSFRPVDFNREGGDSGGFSMEEHYKNMLAQSPGNPLFLRNYAKFLYQEKGDIEGAEEYYSRAILADPEDGDVLCEYAKIIWEVRHDRERAGTYFERAVQASSQDSHIHASYASFLWDTEDEEDEAHTSSNDLIHHGINGFPNSYTSVVS